MAGSHREVGLPADLSRTRSSRAWTRCRGSSTAWCNFPNSAGALARIEEDRAKFKTTFRLDRDIRAGSRFARADVAAEELVRRFQTTEYQRVEHAQSQADLMN